MKKEKIIAFLEKRLTVVEEKAIADKMITDADFAATVEDIKTDWKIQLMASSALSNTKMKEWETASKKEEAPFFASKENWTHALSQETSFLRQLKDDDDVEDGPKPTPKPIVVSMWRRYMKPLAIAASLLFLFTIGTFQWSNANLSSTTLLTDYYEGDLALSRTMGAKETSILSNMETAIQAGQYATAIQAGENLLAAQIDGTTQVKVNYLMAQAYQRQNDYPNAIRYFEIVEKLAVGTAKKKAQINSILLQVASGDRRAAMFKLRSIKEVEADNLGTADLKLLDDLEKKLTHPLRFLVE